MESPMFNPKGGQKADQLFCHQQPRQECSFDSSAVWEGPRSLRSDAGRKALARYGSEILGWRGDKRAAED